MEAYVTKINEAPGLKPDNLYFSRKFSDISDRAASQAVYFLQYNEKPHPV